MSNWTKKAMFAVPVFALGFAAPLLGKYLDGDEPLEVGEVWIPPPYLWLNDVLMGLAFSALIAMPIFIVIAIIRKGARIRPLVYACCCFVAFLLFVAANNALLLVIQLPSMFEHRQRMRKERVDAVSIARLGDRAPSFRIKTTSDSEFSIEGLRGKVVLVNFFATWCGACQQELPHLQELWNEHQHRTDFALIVIGREETDEKVKAFQEKRGFRFPIAADPERAVYSLFAKELIPRTYIISREGNISWSATGFTGDESIAEVKTALRRELSR